VFDVQQKKVAKTLQQPNEREIACAISPDGSRVVGVDERQALIMWDVKRGNEEFRVAGFPFLPYDAAFLMDDGLFCVITGEYEIGLFSSNSGRHRVRIRDPRKVRNTRQGPILQRVRLVAASRLAAKNADGEVLIWNLPHALSPKRSSDE
jgi:hypothetical protein